MVKVFLRYKMAEKQIDLALWWDIEVMENKSEKWMCHQQAIAAIMSIRMVKLGITQRALAAKMSYIQQYVSKVLRESRNLLSETLCKIENALGVKILQVGINK